MPRHSLINGPLGAILVIPMEIPSEISSVTLLGIPSAMPLGISLEISSGMLMAIT